MTTQAWVEMANALCVAFPWDILGQIFRTRCGCQLNKMIDCLFLWFIQELSSYRKGTNEEKNRKTSFFSHGRDLMNEHAGLGSAKKTESN
jgi:hypothetical protein